MGDEAEYLDNGCDYIDILKIQGKRKKTRIINGIIFYRCTKCGQYKLKEEYYSDKRNPCGIRNRCKKCYHK